MANESIFYSWQAQLPQRANRYLIRDALEKAIQQVATDSQGSLAFDLEEDARGALGAAEIGAVLLEKIARCSIFVADITPVGALINSRFTPNPNVMFELGYAWREIGPTHVLLVLNTKYGEPEDMPFDISKRHMVRYAFGDAPGENRATVYKQLVAQLGAQLRAIAEEDEWSDLRAAGLTRQDLALFERVYAQFVQHDADRCDYDDMAQEAKAVGIPEEHIDESVAELARHGLWSAPEYLSPRRFMHIVSTPVGLGRYLERRWPNFKKVGSSVGRLIVDGETYGRTIAEKLELPQIVVDQILTGLERNNYIRTTEDSIGLHVWEVLPQLKRAFRES